MLVFLSPSLTHALTHKGAGSNCAWSCRGYCGFHVLKAERQGGESREADMHLTTLTLADLSEWLAGQLAVLQWRVGCMRASEIL